MDRAYPGGEFAEFIDPWHVELGTQKPERIPQGQIAVLSFLGMQRSLDKHPDESAKVQALRRRRTRAQNAS